MKLFVANINFDATAEDLEDFLSMAGFNAADVKLVRDRQTGTSRGFAFVEIDSASDGQRAVRELHGKEFMGRALIVNEARPEDRDRRGGRDHRGGRQQRFR